MKPKKSGFAIVRGQISHIICESIGSDSFEKYIEIEYHENVILFPWNQEDFLIKIRDAINLEITTEKFVSEYSSIKTIEILKGELKEELKEGSGLSIWFWEVSHVPLFMHIVDHYPANFSIKLKDINTSNEADLLGLGETIKKSISVEAPWLCGATKWFESVSARP